MKIQSAILTNGSGSIGGMTAAKNRGGLYLRSRAAVTNPQTPGQTLIRTSLAMVSTTWRTLTELQREGWYDWAAVNPITNAFGDPILMTGHQAFIALNSSRVQADLPLVPDAPVGFGQPVAPRPRGNGVVLIDGDDVDYTEDVFTEDPGAGDLLTYVSKPQSQTTKFFKGPFNLLKKTPSNPGASIQVAADQTILPAVAEGQVLFFRHRLTLDDGRLSLFFISRVIVTEAP